MKKWEYKSLEWIHKIREENYNRTKDMSPKELIKDIHEQTNDLIKLWSLKIVAENQVLLTKR